MTLLATLETWSRGTGEALGLPVETLGPQYIRGALSVKMMILSLCIEAAKVKQSSLQLNADLEEISRVAETAVEEIKQHSVSRVHRKQRWQVAGQIAQTVPTITLKNTLDFFIFFHIFTFHVFCAWLDMTKASYDSHSKFGNWATFFFVKK